MAVTISLAGSLFLNFVLWSIYCKRIGECERLERRALQCEALREREARQDINAAKTLAQQTVDCEKRRH
jgi:hypothetical protein